MPEWISVKDRLPRNNGMYIVCNNGFVIPAEYATYALGKRSWFGEFSELHKVSHWMPLPEPPEEL